MPVTEGGLSVASVLPGETHRASTLACRWRATSQLTRNTASTPAAANIVVENYPDLGDRRSLFCRASTQPACRIVCRVERWCHGATGWPVFD
jgi:hypothetical protein